MSNFTTRCAETLALPADKRELCLQALEQSVKELENNDDFAGGLNYKVEASGIFFYAEESMDVEALAIVAQSVVDAGDLPPFTFSWADTCDKDVPGAFDGGACTITCGKPPVWVGARADALCAPEWSNRATAPKPPMESGKLYFHGDGTVSVRYTMDEFMAREVANPRIRAELLEISSMSPEASLAGEIDLARESLTLPSVPIKNPAAFEKAVSALGIPVGDVNPRDASLEYDDATQKWSLVMFNFKHESVFDYTISASDAQALIQEKERQLGPSKDTGLSL